MLARLASLAAIILLPFMGAAADDALNHILWYSARGDNIPYPAEFVTSKEEDGPEGEEFR